MFRSTGCLFWYFSIVVFFIFFYFWYIQLWSVYFGFFVYIFLWDLSFIMLVIFKQLYDFRYDAKQIFVKPNKIPKINDCRQFDIFFFVFEIGFFSLSLSVEMCANCRMCTTCVESSKFNHKISIACGKLNYDTKKKNASLESHGKFFFLCWYLCQPITPRVFIIKFFFLICINQMHTKINFYDTSNISECKVWTKKKKKRKRQNKFSYQWFYFYLPVNKAVNFSLYSVDSNWPFVSIHKKAIHKQTNEQKKINFTTFDWYREKKNKIK